MPVKLKFETSSGQLFFSYDEAEAAERQEELTEFLLDFKDVFIPKYSVAKLARYLLDAYDMSIKKAVLNPELYPAFPADEEAALDLRIKLTEEKVETALSEGLKAKLTDAEE